MTVTCIRNAPWVVAWDADRHQHHFRNDVDLVFEDNVIVHLDPGYAGQDDCVIDGRALYVMPGMVNVHTHLQSESLGRGLIEELGNPNLHMTGILDEKSVFVTSGLGEQAGGAPAQLVANRASTGTPSPSFSRAARPPSSTSPWPGTAGSTCWPTPASAPSRRR